MLTLVLAFIDANNLTPNETSNWWFVATILADLGFFGSSTMGKW